MTLYALLVPTFVQMLKGLSGQLDKGAAHGDLLQARLAPDMFPLAAQVRSACYQATEAVAKLTGQAGPARPEDESDLATLKAHIDAAVAFVEGVDPAAFEGAETRTITLNLPGNLVFEMSGEDYVRDWALPQFYFHAVTAYGVLRNAGVPLGKRDFVSHAIKYLKT
jgi:hypothetical protein